MLRVGVLMNTPQGSYGPNTAENPFYEKTCENIPPPSAGLCFV